MIVPNLLLIAGTGNKSGKTTLACRVIEQFRDYGIVAIKITPHFHETTPGLKTLTEKQGYSVFEETEMGTVKDTSRMLKVGAEKVYFAKVNDDNLLKAFLEIMKLVPDGTPVVCESPGLRYFIEPGQFVIMTSVEAYNNKDISGLLKLPHLNISLARLSGMNSLPFRFEDGKWIAGE